MAKHFGVGGEKPRHLRAATPGEKLPDASDAVDTLEDLVQQAVDEFKAQTCNIIDACEQVIIIGCVNGVVATVHSFHPDRHNIMGALRDAYEMTAYPPCSCDCDED